jgi:pimeloyl-ACP methyl ester carboxylesterase
MREVVRHWWGDHLGELRWHEELAALLSHPVLLGYGVPRGDGSPVVAVPGLLADDGMLGVMREWLCRIGYAAYAAEIGVNIDCSDSALDRLERRVAGIAWATGRKVALVGHSRGGQLAKALATRRPELVSSLVSLGAPLAAPFDVSIPLKAFVDRLRTHLHESSAQLASNGCMTARCRCSFVAAFQTPWPASLPCTSVYTRRDGVVWWESCLVPYARCVEVDASHVGMAFSVPVYLQIAYALASRPAGR